MAKTKAESLVEVGLAAKQSKGVNVWVGDLFVPGDGHALAHPRRNDHLSVDPEIVAATRALIDDIKAKKKVVDDILVREEGDPDRPGKKRLLVIDGCRRTITGKIAEDEMIAAGVKFPDGKFYVPVEFFVGDDRVALRERLRRNTNPLKVPDRPSVLAQTYRQAVDLGDEPKALMKVSPNGIGEREINALLCWDNLVPEAKVIFDSGKAPIGLLDAVLKAPRDKMVEVAEELIKAGMTTSKGATRLMNRKAREQAQTAAKAGDGSILPTRREGSTPVTKSERPHPKTLAKILEALKEKHAKMGDGIVHYDVMQGTIKGLELALGMCPEKDMPEWLLSPYTNATQIKPPRAKASNPPADHTAEVAALAP